MSDSSTQKTANARSHDIVMAGLGKRRRAERRFRAYGLVSIMAALVFLVLLFTSIVSKGYSAFLYTNLALDITFDPQMIDPEGARSPEALASGDYDALWKSAIYKLFPDVTERQKKRALTGFVGSSAGQRLRAMVKADPSLIGSTQQVWLPVDDTIDMLAKGNLGDAAELSDKNKDSLIWLTELQNQSRIR
ncbi:MAG: hypothetical protein RL661_178, partial [Pseudomonadota bacterium]